MTLTVSVQAPSAAFSARAETTGSGTSAVSIQGASTGRTSFFAISEASATKLPVVSGFAAERSTAARRIREKASLPTASRSWWSAKVPRTRGTPYEA